MFDTRQKIRFFQLAFRRQVSAVFQESISNDDRVLLGSILLEEVMEYCQKGLGLDLKAEAYDVSDPDCYTDDSYTTCKPGFGYSDEVDAVIKLGVKVPTANDRGLDWREIIDGLADVEVVAHFCAHWHGFNLNYATHVVNESNMSKLDDNGAPIINGVTPGYTEAELPDSMFDPGKPVGKILKSANFKEPNFADVKAFGNPPFDPWDQVGTVLTPISTPLTAVQQSVVDGTFGVRSATDEERAAKGIVASGDS